MSRLSFLGKKSEPLLGIDVGTSSVKVVELAKSGNKISVVSAVSVPLPANVVVDKKISDSEKLVDAIRRAVRLSRTKAKHAAVCVPGSAVITRNLDLAAPPNNEDDLESLLLAEAEQYIPYSLDEVAIDFSVIGESENNPGTSHVLLAACRKESIDDLELVLGQSGLTAKIVDVEPFCIERVYPILTGHIAEDGEGLVAVVDVGYSDMTINILDAGKTTFTREEPFGSRQLIEEIQRRYGLSPSEALAAEQEGDLPEDYEVEVLTPYRELLAQQVNRSLQFFYSSTQAGTVDCIVLSGGSAVDVGVTRLVEERVEVPVYAANPFLNMNINSSIDSIALARDASLYLVATGLALRGLTDG